MHQHVFDLAGTCTTSDGPCDTRPFSTSKTSNWVAKAGGLPDYIRAIAHSLQRSGKSESQAIQIAIGTVQRWARGEGNVTAATRARAAKALAEWEAKRAKSHANLSADEGIAVDLAEGHRYKHGWIRVDGVKESGSRVPAHEQRHFAGPDSVHSVTPEGKAAVRSIRGASKDEAVAHLTTNTAYHIRMKKLHEKRGNDAKAHGHFRQAVANAQLNRKVKAAAHNPVADPRAASLSAPSVRTIDMAAMPPQFAANAAKSKPLAKMTRGEHMTALRKLKTAHDKADLPLKAKIRKRMAAHMGAMKASK